MAEVKNLSGYQNYPMGTRVRIIETGEEGEAFESASGFISVQPDGETTYRFFRMGDIQFLDKKK